MRSTSLVRRAALCVAFAPFAACGGSKAPTPAPTPNVDPAKAAEPVAAAAVAPAPPPPPSPLAAYASRKVAVFPLQRLAIGDSSAQAVSAAAMRPRGAAFDSAFTRTLDGRGLGTQWVLPPAMLKVAQREVVNRTDARALAVTGLGPQRRPNDMDVREPLASQLRALIALTDARWVLIPVEARVFAAADGQRTARVRLALIDGRGGQVMTLPEVAGKAAATEAAALASVAGAAADLIVAP
ncbi:MAG: hypothetical protein MUF21_04570 [Gemmatimonadaceae bacterium]|jgi:hypothetical protein|nr:hypothetical protein [Gemmatimonadaceae bacterium]